jgi:SAM-dependent methyltransferase
MLKKPRLAKNFANLLRSIAHQLIGFFWRSSLSKAKHGSEYQQFLSQLDYGDFSNSNSFQYQILVSRSLQEEQINSRNFPLLEMLGQKKSDDFAEICIDIGSGTGWIANILGETFARVIAIEPNSNAIEVARRFFGNGSKGNIEWHCGHAEKVLYGLPQFDTPVFVLTGVVLSHLPNRVVKRILKYVNDELPIGSSGILCEAYGSFRSEKMWHVRTNGWWQNQLSNCKLDFYGAEREEFPGEYLGIKFEKLLNN